MPERLKNWMTEDYKPGKRTGGGPGWKHLDLSGNHIGVHFEELEPGATSSKHHYHTAEEEHVIVLSGNGTLHLGDEALPVKEGDHVWFPAGEPEAHHFENTTSEPLKILVFGERKPDDVVFYPSNEVVLVKSSKGWKRYTYNEMKSE